MNIKLKHRTLIWYGAIVLVLGGFLYTLSHNTIASPFLGDEGEYAYAAQIFSDGGTPYADNFMQKPPMIIYTYLLAQQFSLDPMAPRILALLSLIGTGLVLFTIVRKLYSLKAAYALALLFPAIIYLPFWNSYSAQPEIFLLLPLTLSWLCYIYAQESKSVIPRILIGVFSAVAIMYKPLVVPAVAFLVLALAIGAYRSGGIKQAARDLLLMAAGFILTTTIILLPIFLRGGPEALYFLIESSFLYNISYAKHVTGGRFRYLHNEDFWLYTTMLWLLMSWFLLRVKQYRWFIVGLFVFLLLGTGLGWMRQYYIIVLPVIAIMTSVALVDIKDLLKHSEHRIISHLVSPFIIVFCVAMLVMSQVSRLYMSPEEVMYYTFGRSITIVTPQVAEQLKRMTAPDDYVFIDGNEPEILYYAHRKSSSRFVIVFPLNLRTPYAEKFLSQFKEDLRKHPPKIILSPLIPDVIKINIERDTGVFETQRDYIAKLITNNYHFSVAIKTDSLNTMVSNSPVITDVNEITIADTYENSYLVFYELNDS